MKLKFETTQAEFVEWVAYAQADKVQTPASVREAMLFWATLDDPTATLADIEPAAREYEARFGVHMPGLAAA